MLRHLDNRELQILYHAVVLYLETGRPVASKGLAKRLNFDLSPASVRAIMARLEEEKMLISPHTSAGRIPTNRALKFVVDRLLEYHVLSGDEKRTLKEMCTLAHKSVDEALVDISLALAGLSACAAMVHQGEETALLKKIEVVFLQTGRGLFMVLGCDGQVRNCVIPLPDFITADHLAEITNYLNAHLNQATLHTLRQRILDEIKLQHAQLTGETQAFFSQNFVSWCAALEEKKGMIIQGHTQLLRSLQVPHQSDALSAFMDLLETEDTLLGILHETHHEKGLHVRVGDAHENGPPFCAFVIAPYRQKTGWGRIGVMGPTYMDYRRIVPMVDYTARLLEHIIEERD